jgi:hypothetical protein
MPIMLLVNLIQIHIGLSLKPWDHSYAFTNENTWFHWTMVITWDNAWVYSGHDIVCIKSLIIWNLFGDLHPLILDTYHHFFSYWIGLNVLNSFKQWCHKCFSTNRSYYYVDHISQHEYVIAIQLLGLLGDGLIGDYVLIQEIAPHINCITPNVLTFQNFPCCNVRFVVCSIFQYLFFFWPQVLFLLLHCRLYCSNLCEGTNTRVSSI